MGCNWISGSIYLGYAFDATDFVYYRCRNSEDEIKYYDDDYSGRFNYEFWCFLVREMTSGFSKFLVDKGLGDTIKKFENIRFYHINQERISNYESEPGDGCGLIVLGYPCPSVVSVVGKEAGSCDSVKFGSEYNFPLNCEDLLEDFLGEYLESKGLRNTLTLIFGLHVGV